MNPTLSSSTGLDHSAPSPLALIHVAVQRLASQSAACKIASVVLAAAGLLFSLSRSGGQSLLWAVAPAALLALVDAAYVGKARTLAELAGTLSPKDPGDPLKSVELLQAQTSLNPLAGIKSLAGVVSLSVWPFYLGLAGLVIGAELRVPQPAPAKFPTSSTGIPYANLSAPPNRPTTLSGMPIGVSQPYRPAGNNPQIPTQRPVNPQNFTAPNTPPGSAGLRPQGASPTTPYPIRPQMPKAPQPKVIAPSNPPAAVPPTPQPAPAAPAPAPAVPANPPPPSNPP